jgi:hypothetical protein
MRAFALVGVAALFACASSNTAPGASNSGVARVTTGGDGMHAISTGAEPIAGKSVVAAPIDKIWGKLPGAYQFLSIPLTTIEPSEHLIGNRGLQLHRDLGGVKLSRYLDCGSTQGAPSADSYDVNLSVITQLEPIDSTHTAVVTTIDAVAKPVLFVGEYVHCGTTGSIESKISKVLAGATQ